MTKGKRINTYFRQTAKAFRAARQTQIFSRIKRNLPYNVFKFSRSVIFNQTRKIRAKIKKENLNYARKIEKTKDSSPKTKKSSDQ